MEKLVIMSLTLGLSWCGTDLCKRVKIREVRPYGHTMCKNLCDCFKSPSIYDFTRLTCRCNVTSDVRDTPFTSDVQDTTVTSDVQDTTVTSDVQDTTVTSDVQDTTVTSDVQDTAVTSDVQETTATTDVQNETDGEHRTSLKTNKSTKTNKYTNRENAVGQRCLTNSSCSFVNTFCYKGKCRCNVGLSLDAKGRCVRHCKNYGTTFAAYDFYSTTGHNNKRVPFINMTECKQRCLTETEFNCISAEFVTWDLIFTKSMSCNLSNDSFLDALDSERGYGQTKDKRWYFFTRNCKGAKHIG